MSIVIVTEINKDINNYINKNMRSRTRIFGNDGNNQHEQ